MFYEFRFANVLLSACRPFCSASRDPYRMGHVRFCYS